MADVEAQRKPEWPAVYSFHIPAGRSLSGGSSSYVGADSYVKGKKYGVLMAQDEPFSDVEAAKNSAVELLRKKLMNEGVVA